MKKTPPLLLVLIAGMAPAAGGTVLAGNPLPMGDILWEHPYDYSTLDDGYYINAGRLCQDDFVIDSQSDIEAFTVWTVYDNSHPRNLEVALYNDNGGSPGSEFWRVTVDAANITDTDTGDDNWGYDLWETRLELDPADVYEDLAPGTYWFEVSDPGTLMAAWLGSLGGNMYYIGNPTAHDAFFVVEGTPNSAVVGSSWGAIKALD